MRHRRLAILVRFILALVLAFPAFAIPLSGAAADPYEIDAIVSLTGPGSFVGHDQQQALLAVEDLTNRTGGIGGRPVKMVIHDDATNPQVTVQLFNAIAAKHAAILLGPAIAATCGAIEPLVRDIVAYCFSPGIHPVRGSYMFSTSTESTDQTLAVFTYFAQRGLTKIATITSTDATGQDADRGLEEAAAKVKAIELVDREHFGPTDISVAAQITRIKASNAQVLIGWSTGTPFGTILRGVSDAGLTLPLLTTAGNMSVVQLKQYGAIMPKDLLFPGVSGLTPDLASSKTTTNAIALFDRELAKAGAPVPGFPHQTAWDPAMILISALRKFGPNATGTQIHDYVENLRGWVGINGPYDFVAHPQRGLGLESVVITRWVPSTEKWEAASKGGGAPLAAR